MGIAPLPLWAEEEPVTVRADHVEYLETHKKMVAFGGVQATYRDIQLTCEEAVFYLETQDAYLKGRVRLVQLNGILKGEEILYNFRTRKGTVLMADSEAGPFISHGERAQQYASGAFRHREGYITTCDFEQPHTRLQAKEVQVYLDDKVVLRHAVMYVGNIPVLYLPSYTHPLDDKRPRVTIIPGKDKQWGAFVLTAWRVYLHENLQGRFHVDFRERLDLATGIDLTYRLPFGGEGVFREYYTHERAIQREHFWSKLTDPEDDRPTIERERYRFQVRHVWQIDPSTRATLEYHRRKDPNFIKDFFLREFEEQGANPPTYLQVIRMTPWYGLTFLLTKRVNRFETVTQQLPFLQLDLRPMRIPWLPRLDRWQKEPQEDFGHRLPNEKMATSLWPSGWYYQSSYIYEHSNVADRVDGTEDSLLTFKTSQELFHPFRLMHWLNIRPFFQFHQASFSRGAHENAPLFRQAGAVGFDLSTKLFRTFPIQTNAFGLDLNRLRHVITPTVQYLFQGKPTVSADRLLRSDGLAKVNRVTFGMEHKLQTKRGTPQAEQTVDLVRFSSSMPYDLEGFQGQGGEWNDWSLDLETRPYPWMRLESDAKWDPHDGRFKTINADWILHPKVDRSKGTEITKRSTTFVSAEEELPWMLGLGWRYQRNTSTQLTFETEFNLTPKWRVGIFQTLDVKRFVQETSSNGTRTVKKIYDLPEQEFRLRRDLHEWTIELIYNVRRNQGEMVLLLFRLKAAPELPLPFKRHYHQPKSGRNISS